MNPAASHLVRRVLGFQAAFTLFVSLLVTALAPQFLLLHGSLAIDGALALGYGVFAGGLPALVIGGVRLRRYRFLLRALAVGSTAVEAHELYGLADEPRRGIVAWLVPTAVGVAIAETERRRVAVLVVVRAVAHLGPAGEPVRVRVVAVVTTARGRTVTVTVLVDTHGPAAATRLVARLAGPRARGHRSREAAAGIRAARAG